ncbi:MAG: hypothetical protein INH41_21270 [Myxococcaceae bacterium]|jgi:hypothetical protein|nr:hypothetical protein [Myxococcaceae bacterium]MCA3014925.1 hypothetical protein [Myxococcaceae bacterium]
MKPTHRLLLAALALALTGAGAWLLLDDDGPAETVAATTTPPAAAPPSPPRPAGPAVADAPPPPTPPVAGGAPAAVLEPPAPAAPPPEPHPAEDPVVEVAPSPFLDQGSEELQYAVHLVTGPGTGPTEWRKAAEVFQRCIDVNPTNHLCRRGVYAAYERIDSDGGPATALDTGVTSLTGPLQPAPLDPTSPSTNTPLPPSASGIRRAAQR